MKKKKPMTRSENMSKVKNKNTQLEIFIRKLLWHRGVRYRLNYKELPGSPDLYIPKYRTAIFVNGCFWHKHENCKYSSIPKKNHDFWENKLALNVERDKRNYEQLESQKIKVLVVWGCEIKKMMKNDVDAVEEEENFVKKFLLISGAKLS